MTASWRWAGARWGAVVQPRTEYVGRNEDLVRRVNKPWEQGGYDG